MDEIRCPMCGNTDLKSIIDIYPPVHKLKCINCDSLFNESYYFKQMDDSTHTEYDNNKEIQVISKELSEYFGIPCNLCNKYFKPTNSECPVEKCGGNEHWKMLLTKICQSGGC